MHSIVIPATVTRTSTGIAVNHVSDCHSSLNFAPHRPTDIRRDCIIEVPVIAPIDLSILKQVGDVVWVETGVRAGPNMSPMMYECGLAK